MECNPVLVTGANGFIGRHLTKRLLSDGFAVRALVRNVSRVPQWPKEVEVKRGDVRNLEEMKTAISSCTTVFHLASEVHDFRELFEAGEYEGVIVRGTQNLLAAAAKSSVKAFIFLSSLSVYGYGSNSLRDETAACCPVSAYGREKLRAEQFVLGQGKKLGIHVCCLRPALVYGPGCKGNLPRMIRMIDRGVFPPLPDFGNRRSLVHVSDVVQAAMLAASDLAASGQCYIVTDGRPYSTRELYEWICLALGKRIPRWCMPIGTLKVLGLAGDAIGWVRGKRFMFDSDGLEKLFGSAWYSSEKISGELGYRPSVTFEDALPQLIAWYRKSQT